MIDIKKCFLDINLNLKVSDISDFDSKKIEIAVEKCSKIENIVMFAFLNDNNKEYLEKCIKACKYLKSMDFISSESAVLNRMKISAHKIYMNSRRKEIPEATDSSNLNELNIDYYHDKIQESKLKYKKFSFDVIEEPVDLNKELSDDYIQECKNSEIKVDKLEKKLTHKIYENIEVLKYKDTDKNILGVVIHKGLFEIIYEDITEDDIKEIYENINKKIEQINLNKSS